jgi:hypothetical protein
LSKVPVGVDQQELYVAARRVLLDALDALAEHRDAIVLVGAQAVYQHTASAQLGVAAYTSDGDLALNPAQLADEPLLQAAMQAAGFSRDLVEPDQPGLWWKPQTISHRPINIEIDLLVPHGLSTGGRRSAKIPPHDGKAVLRVPGIEVAIVDNALTVIASLEPAVDPRAVSVRVAGVAALLVAKAIKIGERLTGTQPDRMVDKDASDVLGMMMATDADQVAATFSRLLTHQDVSDVTRNGLNQLRRHFGAPRATGVEMAVRALAGVQDEDAVRALAPAFLAQLPDPPSAA